MIIAPKIRVGYQFVPKVASTTITDWMYGLCASAPFAARALAGESNAKRKYFKRQQEGNRVVPNTHEAVRPYRGEFHLFAVTRDPIRRFISMYSNRVLHYRELSSASRGAARLRDAGLPFDPDINALVTRLDEYLRAAPSILHHTRPMVDFLGPDLGVYHSLVDISRLDEVIASIKANWIACGLEQLVDQTPALKRHQTGGPKLPLGILSERAFEALVVYYAEDYARIPTVDLAVTRQEYLAARQSQEPLPDILFASRARASAAPEPTTSLRARIEVHDCEAVVQCVVKDVPDARAADDGDHDIRGVVVLHHELAQRQWVLLLSDGEGERRVKWRLPSPTISTRNPGNPNARNARFEATSVRPGAAGVATLLLQHATGRREVIATLRV